MNKKGLLAVLLACLLPLLCYFIISHYSEKSITMPGHYIADSINPHLKNGKEIYDTAWHQISDFKLINQLGDTVTLNTYKNKIIIADFFFTHCTTICPALTVNMRRLQQSITNAQKVGDNTNPYIQFLSFSIDPERDSVARLKAWADRFQINPENWDLLTGDKKTIYDLALNDMKIGIADGKGIDTSFIHTDHFVLIDSLHNIRGYYHGLDSASLAKLTEDLVLLTLEKDHHKKSELAKNINLLAIMFVIVAIAVGLFLILFKNKKNVDTRMEEK